MHDVVLTKPYRCTTDMPQNMQTDFLNVGLDEEVIKVTTEYLRHRYVLVCLRNYSSIFVLVSYRVSNLCKHLMFIFMVHIPDKMPGILRENKILFPLGLAISQSQTYVTLLFIYYFDMKEYLIVM